MSAIEAFNKSSRYVDLMSSDRIPYPETLIIELTTKQQHGCHCPTPLTSSCSEDTMDISEETLKYLQTSVIPYVQRIHLKGRGDPLQSPELLEIILNAASEFSVPVVLDTHGFNLDDDKILTLIQESTVQKINLTVNAPDEKSHLNVCGCSLEAITAGLNKLMAYIDGNSERSLEICLKMVATIDNIELLPEMINYAVSQRIFSLVIVPMSVTDDPEKKSAFRFHRDKTEEVLYRSLIECEMKGFELKTEPDQLMDAMSAVDNMEQYLSGQVPPEPDNDQWVRDCSCLWNHTIVDADSNVLPCYGGFPPVGNLVSQSFQEIWFSSHMRTMRQNLLSGCGASECSTCSHLLWRKIKSLKSILTPSDEYFSFFPGWYEPELDERTFRWTRERATLFLQHQKEHLFAIIQMRKSAYQNAADSGKIIINQTDVHPFKLESNQWETWELPLSDNITPGETISIEVRPKTATRPVDVSENSTDSRTLGIKVGKVWLESWAKKVVFNKQLILLGYEVSPETWEMDGDAVFRTFWRTLSQTEQDMKLLLEITRDEDDSLSQTEFRVDTMQFDYILEHRGLNSSNWAPGVFIAQEHRIPIPDNLIPGHYRISVGVYPEGSPKKRLKIARSDREHSNNMALLGTVLISQQKR